MTDRYETEIDPVTMFPKEDKPLDAIKASRLSDQKNRSEILKASIASETGQAVLLKIEEHLLGRVKVLMMGDPECKVLVKLLADMGLSINFGEVAVKRMMRMVKGT